MSTIIMCRVCGATGDPFVPHAWRDLRHLLDTCVRVAARQRGEPVMLHYEDAANVYNAHYEHERAPVSLDLGYHRAALNGTTISLRDMLRTFARDAGVPVRFERAYTTQGAPIFTVRAESKYHPMRVAIGIGDTWTDAVARALDMWLSGT